MLDYQSKYNSVCIASSSYHAQYVHSINIELESTYLKQSPEGFPGIIFNGKPLGDSSYVSASGSRLKVVRKFFESRYEIAFFLLQSCFFLDGIAIEKVCTSIQDSSKTKAKTVDYIGTQ